MNPAKGETATLNPDKSVQTAILLAAGRGSRLSPFTDNTPKPLLPYRGRPTLAWTIDSLVQSGVSRLLIVTHYLEPQIIDFIDQHIDPNTIEIKTVRQKKMDGTATAVMQAVDSQPDWFNNTFVVSATDYLVEPSFYPDLVQFHYSHDSAMSISLKRLPQGAQSMRSSVRISDDMRITEVVEKPAPGAEPSPFTANLVYILPASIVGYFKRIKPSVRGELELQSAINLWLDDHGYARGLLQITPQEWKPGMC